MNIPDPPVVRLVNCPPVSKADSSGQTRARTWRRLWLWPSPVGRSLSDDAIRKLISAMAKPTIRDMMEIKFARSLGGEAHQVAEEARTIAADALAQVENNRRVAADLLDVVEQHGAILERLTGLHDRGAAMVPPMDATKQAGFEAEWAAGLHDRVNVVNDGVVSTNAIEAEARLRELSMILTLPDEVMALPIPAAVRDAIVAARWLLEAMVGPPGLAPEADVVAAKTDA